MTNILLDRGKWKEVKGALFSDAGNTLEHRKEDKINYWII